MCAGALCQPRWGHVHGPATRPAPRTRRAWPARLAHRELEPWGTEGLLDDKQAAAILRRYPASRRFWPARLLLSIGAIFVGVGLIWLVAVNLDEFPPLGRLGAVALIWLGVLVGGEVLAARGSSPAPSSGRSGCWPPSRFGAVMFQAAQSLQVPAYEPRLVGLWAAGALLHAYAVRSRGPLLVGLVTGTGWYVWQLVAECEPSVLAAVVGLGGRGRRRGGSGRGAAREPGATTSSPHRGGRSARLSSGWPCCSRRPSRSSTPPVEPWVLVAGPRGRGSSPPCRGRSGLTSGEVAGVSSRSVRYGGAGRLRRAGALGHRDREHRAVLTVADWAATPA